MRWIVMRSTVATRRPQLQRLSVADGEVGSPAGPLPLHCEQPASAWWSGAQVARRPARGADRQHHGTRCLEGDHTLGAQRVHLLGRGCQAGNDPRTAHSPDPGGTGGWSAPALLLAGLQAPRPHRQVAAGAPAFPRWRPSDRAPVVLTRISVVRRTPAGNPATT